MKNKILLSIIISLLLIISLGCNKQKVDQSVVVAEYFSYLGQSDWENAYQLLSKPTKEKISLVEFSEWGKLANSVRLPQGSKTIKESKVTEFGNNEDMVIFDEVKIVTTELNFINKLNTTEAGQEKNIVHTVIGLEDGKWKVYLDKLEKGVYFKELGKKYQAEKNHSQAAAFYQKALKEDGEDVWAKYRLAENLAQLKDTDEAIKLMLDVIEQNEMVLSFSVVEELKENLIQQYTFLVMLLEEKGEQKNKIQKYLVRIEELKQK